MSRVRGYVGLIKIDSLVSILGGGALVTLCAGIPSILGGTAMVYPCWGLLQRMEIRQRMVLACF